MIIFLLDVFPSLLPFDSRKIWNIHLIYQYDWSQTRKKIWNYTNLLMCARNKYFTIFIINFLFENRSWWWWSKQIPNSQKIISILEICKKRRRKWWAEINLKIELMFAETKSNRKVIKNNGNKKKQEFWIVNVSD